ncbi:asparagine synthetase B family protein [Gordonia hydrophobica]|uniref:asparagine synthase (glutamine-hydrolyzing) n=1 Tax=Gordonia hydrophobica TaxID=40516 RepID=A0ABZ2U3E8_9ACTN|nr:asparagine synthase-related protein [Gordonia hydrophobica]MBM7367515.1 asparagine synthase (glutamine-hydrolyzing) [Gordonia hydrophobica]
MTRFLVSQGEPTLVDGPGVATGPVRAGRLRAIGEATVFNGDALRRTLRTAVDPPSTDLDLVLRLYADRGLRGIADIEGMFAVAIVDGDDLVVLRDHVGSRTLFYTRTADGWAASSSLRALTRLTGCDTGLNLRAVQSFLTFAYLPGAETFFRGIAEALPGRSLRLHADGRTSPESFWEPVEVDDPGEPRHHAAQLRERLEQAVVRRLPASEPVGVLLSGGVDSSLVAALATKLHDHPVTSYSIAFDTDTPNELGYSGMVAAHCHIDQQVLTVTGTAIADRMAETVALLDCPVGDPLTVPNLMLAEAAAAQGHSVILNGEGGDPVFGGPKNLPMLIFELFRTDPSPQARATAYLDSYRKCLDDLPTLLTADALAGLETTTPTIDVLLPYLQQGQMRSLLNQLLHVNLRTKGAHHILTKVERLTAASGVEGRAPLFDRDVVDYAFRIPPQQKFRGTSEKWILKEAVRDLLPATIVDRPKSGMRVPVQQWLDGPLSELTNDVLGSRAAVDRALLRPETVRAWLRKDGALLPRHGGKLWLVLTLELWLQSFEVGR